MAGTSSWEVVYKHLVLVESHWTAQIQNQQQRNGAVMTVTGFLLGFSGLTGAIAFQGQWDQEAVKWFGWGLFALASALALGLLSMWPSIPPRSHPWLQANATAKLGAGVSEDAYRVLAERLADDIGDGRRRTLLLRRVCIWAEIILIGVGLVLLGGCIALILTTQNQGVFGGS